MFRRQPDTVQCGVIRRYGDREPTEHFTPVGYMEIGWDATVSYGSLDFVFRNDFARPVYVLADDEPGALTTASGNAADKPADTDLHRSEIGDSAWRDSRDRSRAAGTGDDAGRA